MFTFYDTSYDVIVVGAGPGGSIFAKEASEKGLKVLLLERDREIGTPVRCAEAVGLKGLLEFFDEDHWLVKRYRKKYSIRFVAPNSTPLDLNYNSDAAVLDRKVFDYELGRRAALAGATVITGCSVDGLLFENDIVCGVKCLYAGKSYEIKSKLVIGADGIETRVGRWAGLKTNPSLEDLESCAQYTLTNINIDPNRFDFYFGKEIVPTGYIWVFPKGKNTANIGLGINGNFSKTKRPIQYLDEFVQKTFPNSSIISRTTGGVICGDNISDIYTDNVMLIGDAAHHTNAISGGGIINAMKAGRIAAIVAKEALDANDFSEKFLKRYSKLWNKAQGNMNHKFYKIKEIVNNIDDKVLDKVTDSLNKKDKKKRTLIAVFKMVLLKYPKLILELPKLFG